MPPVLAFFTTWRVEPVALGTVVVAFLLYTAGIVTTRRGGSRWPLHRALSFYLFGSGWDCLTRFGM
jgi:cytochrome c oxidase assembly factor CtaG